MKLILDFDDVLLSGIKEQIFGALEKEGVPYEKAERYYVNARARPSPYSLKNFLGEVFDLENIDKSKGIAVYENILSTCPHLLNAEVVNIVKKIRKENSFIVTNGDEEYQKDKIKRSGIWPLFSEIYITHGNKKEIIENICLKYKDEKIIFADDKQKYFDELDMKVCKNLKTILFDQSGLEKLQKETK
jgi:FMN phosphatase YigB (HAD superfamily)